MGKTTKPVLDGWLERWPKADWAIRHTDTVVVDVEMKHGLNGIKDLLDMVGMLPPTTEVKSKSGGKHLWFRAPADCPKRGAFITVNRSVEIKYGNATAHIPPSMGYSWQMKAKPPELLPELPSQILSLWKHNAVTQTADYNQPKYSEGSRHHMLCAMAKYLRQSCGLCEPELIAALLAVRTHRCEGDFNDEAVIAIAKSYAHHKIGAPIPAALAGDIDSLLICKLMKDMGAL